MKYLILTCCLITLVALGLDQKVQTRFDQPVPTGGTIVLEEMEEGGSKSDARNAWIESIHRAAPGINWKTIELQNSLEKQNIKSQYIGRNDEVVVIADGAVTGVWYEKGSRNQAGNVIATTYDRDNDEIYVVADGGAIFKGKPSGEDEWQVVQQDIVLNGETLELINFNGGKRMIATAAANPLYSDDMGKTWTAATGIPIDDGNAVTYNCLVIGDENPWIYFLTKRNFGAPINVYRSTNGGRTYHPIRALGNNDTGKFWLTSPEGTEELFLFDNINDNRTDIYRYKKSVNVFFPIVTTTQIKFGEFTNEEDATISSPVNMQSVLTEDGIRFYAYAQHDSVMMSVDTGRTWIHQGKLPEHPWSRRFFAFSSNEDHLLAGGVDLYRSENEGATWDLVNKWWEYYDDVENKLHADMMYFKEFERNTGERFTLISNHGGISLTTDFGLQNTNIAMSGLNVCQYYSVRTDPNDRRIIYAGAQDQGFQRGVSEEDVPVDFDQLISGDYGHIVFSEFGTRMWTVYPFGSVSYYHNPQTDDGPTVWYELVSEHENGWIPPLAESPRTDVNEIYMAGGNANGGPGAYLIRLEFKDGLITADQFDYDFRDASFGTVSSIAFSPFDPDLIYVGTSTGDFFTSEDGGETFAFNNLSGPTGHYLYGNTIYPSVVDQDVVYYGGSGYSNPGVYKSEDRGFTFQPMGEGLPATLVFQLTANADESRFFAATEAGPYVYVLEDQRWYSLAGNEAPTTRFWSVEYLDDLDRVRFGTYGRGVWDFELTESVGIAEPILASEDWKIYPNPAADQIWISMQPEQEKPDYVISILNMNGQVLQQTKHNSFDKEINIQGLKSGPYMMALYSSDQIIGTKIFIKQ